MARRRRVTSKSSRRATLDADTLPAPAGPADAPPLSVPGLRDVASSFAETLVPPAPEGENARTTPPPGAEDDDGGALPAKSA